MKNLREDEKMKTNQFVVMVMSIMSVLWVSAGKMEDYGGFKARDYKKGSDGKLYTSSGEVIVNFRDDLTAEQQKDYIEAAKMASSGYTDARYNDYKTAYYQDGATTGYQEVDEKALVNILNKASESARTEGHSSELYINKSTKIKGTDEYALMITGRGDSRLNARIFIKKDEKGKETIGIVFGGTNGFKDIVDDVLNVATPITAKPYKEAVELLKAVKAAYPDCDINVYGHSEGGGEAMFAVLSEGVHNGKNGTVKYYGVNSAGLYGLKTNNDIDPNKITPEEIRENFILIQNKDEKLGGILPVSEVAYQFGTVILIPDMYDIFGEGDEAFTNRSTNKNKSNLDGEHGIEETLWKMTHCPSAEDKTLTKGNDDSSPFDSDPDPQNGTTQQVSPVPNNTIRVRPSTATRIRRGGGGDTKARIW